MSVWNTWAQHGRTERDEAERRLAELARVAETKKLAACPGIQLEQNGADEPPTKYRDDATARRAQALFDLHCGIEPETQPHL